jgi:asparagine synthase (glutamine-hydrolysing)
MCGICGIYDPRGRVDPASLKDMAHALRHRGPDDEGLYVEGGLGLGHQRLSIIDLSPAGRQPMADPTGRFHVVLNGEIYNYLELRRELVAQGHVFRTATDTEVLLHLFSDLGAACVPRLNGMFAFAVWDSREKTLFAARDRLGIKPFYYAYGEAGLIFASEIKALFRSGRLRPRINPEGVADYLTFQFCLGDKTLFGDVRELLPGHTLKVGADGVLSVEKYWDLDFTVDLDHTEAYFQRCLLDLLDDAVRLQLRADVPVGAHLSGGLDSSAIACLAAPRLSAPLSTFSGGFKEPGYDETPYARLVAGHIGSDHHEVFPEITDFIDLLPRLIYYMDQPAAGPGLFPQYCVSRLARESVKVVLGGLGGDEAFGGYTRYLMAYLEECIRGGIQGTQEDHRYVVTFESILPNLPQLEGYQPLLREFWREGLFDPPDLRYFRLIDRSGDLRRVVAPELLGAEHGYSPREAFRAIFNEGRLGSYINRMTRFDLKALLPALLQVEDRTSMSVSLESRLPLLDHRLMELVAAVPPMIKYRGGRSKHLFREAVRGTVPSVIVERTDKMGFPVPLTEWYREGTGAEFVRDTLLGTRARQRGMFQTSCIEPLLESERPYGRTVWGLLSLELWMQTFLDGCVSTCD